jgi:hypothetical protein
MRPEFTRAPDAQSHATGYDEPYTVGRPPATYLTLREIARLMILRSKLCDRLAAGTPRE